jgi:hypothetical protein
MCHNQHKSTVTDQELSPDLCVERLASNRMSPDMLLFLAAKKSEISHCFLTLGDTQRNTLHVLFFVPYVYTNSLPSQNLRIT